METPSQVKPTANDRRDKLRLSELIHIIKLRRRYLIAFTLLTVLGTLVRQFAYVPVFTAEARVQVTMPHNSALSKITGSDLISSLSEGGDHEQILKYTSYLRSMSFYISVAEVLKFRPEYSKMNLTRPSELSILKSMFWDHFIKTKFGRQDSRQFHDDSTIEPVLVPVEKLAGILYGITKIEHDGIRAITFAVTTLDPYTSMVISNLAAEAFSKLTGESDQYEVDEMQRFVEERLKETAEKLKKDELELIGFKQKNNIISIHDDTRVYSDRLNRLESQIETSKLSVQENERLISYYEKKISRKEKALLQDGTMIIPAQDTSNLRTTLENLRRQKFLMSTQGYGEDHWRMIDLTKAISETTEKLKTEISGAQPVAAADSESHMSTDAMRAKVEELRSANKILSNRIEAVAKGKEELVGTMSNLPADTQKLLTLTQNVNLQYDLYSSLKKKLQDIEMQRMGLKARVKIELLSRLPGPTPRPGVLGLLLFAIVAGLFFGCVVAVIVEMLDSTVKHRSDLEECELQMLGNLPFIETPDAGSTLAEESFRTSLLVCSNQPDSAEAMAFKYIRAQLADVRTSDGKSARALTITSPDRAEGKSFFSTNMAVCMAQLDKKVILLDCDFRNPSTHKYLGFEPRDGLTGLLTMNMTLSDVLLSNVRPNLDVLPAGWAHPNPTELISNDKFRLLLKHLKTKYDYIIIDAPPTVFMVDAAVMGAVSDGVILVANYRQTSKDALMMAHRKILQISHRRAFGVLNAVKDIHEYTSYYVMPYMAAKGGKNVPYGIDKGGKNGVARTELDRFEELLNQKAS